MGEKSERSGFIFYQLIVLKQMLFEIHDDWWALRIQTVEKKILVSSKTSRGCSSS